MTVVFGITVLTSLPVLNYVYLSVPVGVHTFVYYMYSATLMGCFTCLFRIASGDRVPPLLSIYLGGTTFAVAELLAKIPVIKHRDERDGRVERYGIRVYLLYPESMRYDKKLRKESRRFFGMFKVSTTFVLLYPILGGIFFQAGVVLQACLVPVFFLLRIWYEHKLDSIITHTYGSDSMPSMGYFGVLLHEICLSTMITSIKHPVIFVTLVFADVFENVFCLWSLSRSKSSSSSSVVPIENESSTSQRNTYKKSLTKRSSSVFSLAKDLQEVEDESSEGTALFIAAILLQREMAETIVPMQSALVMTLLYYASDVKSNSMVSHWSSEDEYIQAMTYLGIDLGVELIVFVCSILALKRIYPKFSAFRILMGIVKADTITMFANTFAAWLCILIYQNTLSGLDLSFKFEWLNCDSNNATWVGGFDWDNC